jgi:gas vesicle protein
MNSGKILLGVLAGLAAGALIGVLFAPKKGSDTRKKIAQKGENYAESLKEKFNEFLDNVSEKSQEVKEEMTHFADKVKSKAEDVKKDVKSAVS